MKWTVSALLIGFATTPAFADEPYAITPSGQTEAIFDLDVTSTSDRIVNGCIDVGWTAVSSTPTMVVCEANLGTMESVLAQLFIGNSYSTPPRQFIRFNIAGLRRSARVQATGWVETQMAFGQVRKQDMASAHYHNNVMSLFRSIGGRFPPGTSFPYHAYLGASFVAREKPRGLEIIEIEAGSPAEKAGLELGDIVTRIAKERTKGYDDILDALRKAAKKPVYEIEFTRSHGEMKLAIEREYRAAVLAPNPADLPQEPEPIAPQVNAIVQLSPADELAKFAKLKDDGILSDEEFEAQKSRLLGTGSAPTAAPISSAIQSNPAPQPPARSTRPPAEIHIGGRKRD